MPEPAAVRQCSPGTGSIIKVASLLILALCVLTGISTAAISTTLGSTVHLAGISYGSSSVYLFVTGPNLPAEGVALNNIAGGEGRTKVSVDVDGSWSYNWDTHGMPLDAGSYTVWVADVPVGRAELAGSDFATISVSFSRPSVRAETTAVPGSLEIRAVPENSSVVVDGQYRGMTPLILDGLPPSIYTVTVSHFGYRPATRSIAVGAGSMTAINFSLVPMTGAVRISTEPSGSRILLDGRSAGISPLTLQDVPAGNHTIIAQQGGYKEAATAVFIPAGGAENVTLSLQPAQAGLSATQAGNRTVSAAITLAAGILACAGFRRL